MNPVMERTERINSYSYLFENDVMERMERMERITRVRARGRAPPRMGTRTHMYARGL